MAADATPAQVRRAYAQRLRGIDVETQLAEFQQLREAYEAALEGRRQTPEEADAPDSLAAVRTDEPALSDLAEFQVRCDRLLLSEERLDQEAWSLLLARFVRELESAELERAADFTAALVAQLAAGWQPGHDLLLEALSVQLGWAHDHLALEPFGAAGALLDAALTELQVIRLLKPYHSVPILRILALLRLPPERYSVPDERLRRCLRLAHHASRAFPHAFTLAASAAHLDEWHARWKTTRMPAAERAALAEPLEFNRPFPAAEEVDGHWMWSALRAVFWLTVWLLGLAGVASRW
ncbi:MAG: hypothetical protein ACXWKJ_17480 [Telluria sp.]